MQRNVEVFASCESALKTERTSVQMGTLGTVNDMFTKEIRGKKRRVGFPFIFSWVFCGFLFIKIFFFHPELSGTRYEEAPQYFQCGSGISCLTVLASVVQTLNVWANPMTFFSASWLNIANSVLWPGQCPCANLNAWANPVTFFSVSWLNVVNSVSCPWQCSWIILPDWNVNSLNFWRFPIFWT